MSHNKKLTDDQVREIHWLYSIGLNATTIAEHYKVSYPAILYHIRPVKDMPKLPLSELLKMKRTHELQNEYEMWEDIVHDDPRDEEMA